MDIDFFSYQEDCLSTVKNDGYSLQNGTRFRHIPVQFTIVAIAKLLRFSTNNTFLLYRAFEAISMLSRNTFK